MLVLHAIVSMGPARRCAQMRGRAAQRTICIDIWNLLGKFGNDQEHSVTHVQKAARGRSRGAHLLDAGSGLPRT